MYVLGNLPEVGAVLFLRFRARECEEERARKKRKRRERKKKAQIRAFSSLPTGSPVPELKDAWQGEQQGS